MSNIIDSERYSNHMKTASFGHYRNNLNNLVTAIRILNVRDNIYRGLEGRGVRKKAENLIARWNREDGVTVNNDVVPLVAEAKEEYLFENGMEVPVGTIVISGGTRYKLEKFRKNNNGTIEISLMYGSGFKAEAAWYNIPLINKQIQNRSFSIEDVKIREIPRVKKFLDSYTNVIKSTDFKNINQTAFSGNNFYINAGVTGNCQLTTMCSAQNLITTSSNIPEQLKEVAKKAGRRIILMDIKLIYLKKLKDNINANSILLSENYKSTNGSSMHIILIDTSKV